MLGLLFPFRLVLIVKLNLEERCSWWLSSFWEKIQKVDEFVDVHSCWSELLIEDSGAGHHPKKGVLGKLYGKIGDRGNEKEFHDWSPSCKVVKQLVDWLAFKTPGVFLSLGEIYLEWFSLCYQKFLVLSLFFSILFFMLLIVFVLCICRSKKNW